ncbi:hypothetical protein E9531_15990 [Lampropedia puyangensis]|uniref:3-hydroxyacyl-CoA dehydrogenase n=1 Tax=Lampropedia puyangensis TaxID=1330072 RepID=A0A4S8ESZ5_9BURK|nr:hypothetical protein E9531_15990 [Lampropedia puyangensis]
MAHDVQSYVQWAQQQAAALPGFEAVEPRAVEYVGVIGGGTMGAGIAVALLQAGLQVHMVERDASAAQKGYANVEKVFSGMVSKGKLSEQGKADTLARFDSGCEYAALGEVDLVIEAAFEDMAVKQSVFEALDTVCKPGAVLATNTSYLDIDVIAGYTQRAQDVIGLHFFSPAHIMKLLEVVVPTKVAPEVVATAFALAKRLGKVPVRAGVCDGFIGNRMLAVYRQAAEFAMEDGATPYQIDEALRAFGFAMGPFQVADLAGGDIGWATRKRRAATRDPQARYVQIADRLCERGWFGQKTGRGYYLYENGSRNGAHDEQVLQIIDAERLRAGVVPRTFTNEEIVRRYMVAMVNEGANIVHEGVALRPLDVDVTLLYGYGFPREKGGPMFWADAQGLPEVLADIERYAKEDALFWKPSPLLRQLVAQGQKFESLNGASAATAVARAGA